MNDKQTELEKDDLENVSLLSEEDKKDLFRASGLGLVGSVLLGPIGLVAGVFAGGNKKEVTLVCQLKNGDKFMAITDMKIFQKLMSYTL